MDFIQNFSIRWNTIVQQEGNLLHQISNLDSLVKGNEKTFIQLFLKNFSTNNLEEKNLFFSSYFLKEISIANFTEEELILYHKSWENTASKIQTLIEQNTVFSRPSLWNLIHQIEKSKDKETILLLGEKLKKMASKNEDLFNKDLFLFIAKNSNDQHTSISLLKTFFSSFQKKENFQSLCDLYVESGYSIKNRIEKLGFATKHQAFLVWVITKYDSTFQFFQNFFYQAFLTENVLITKTLFNQGMLLNLSENHWKVHSATEITQFFAKNTEKKEILAFNFKGNHYVNSYLKIYLEALKEGLFFNKESLTQYMNELVHYGKIITTFRENLKFNKEDILSQLQGEAKSVLLSLFILYMAMGSKVDPLLEKLSEQKKVDWQELKEIFKLLYEVDWKGICESQSDQIPGGSYFEGWDKKEILLFNESLKALQQKNSENDPLKLFEDILSSDDESGSEEEPSLASKEDPLKRKFFDNENVA